MKIHSGVGSGDAAVAAFAYSVSHRLAPEETVQLAAACGAANCVAESPGFVKAADISRLQGQIRVEVI
jgi:fructose-1-phosphate kinase PfkB-like protein